MAYTFLVSNVKFVDISNKKLILIASFFILRSACCVSVNLCDIVPLTNARVSNSFFTHTKHWMEDVSNQPMNKECVQRWLYEFEFQSDCRNRMIWTKKSTLQLQLRRFPKLKLKKTSSRMLNMLVNNQHNKVQYNFDKCFWCEYFVYQIFEFYGLLNVKYISAVFSEYWYCRIQHS